MIAETYNTSGVPVDYQDRMAQRMTDREKWIRLANDWYDEAFKASRKQVIDEVLAIVDELEEETKCSNLNAIQIIRAFRFRCKELRGKQG